MTERIDHNCHLRYSGRTTRQIVNAPLNTVYVWVNGYFHCPELIARKYGRVDIVFVRPSWLRHANLRGYAGEIVIDHAVSLTGVEWDAYSEWKAWKEYRAGCAKATKTGV